MLADLEAQRGKGHAQPKTLLVFHVLRTHLIMHCAGSVIINFGTIQTPGIH